jgi:hypothetical protein
MINDKSRIRFGDLETYPNFFCCTFLEYESDNYKIFYISSNSSREVIVKTFTEMENYMKQYVNVFYNGLDYDITVLNFCFKNKESINTMMIKSFSNQLINEEIRPYSYKHKQENFILIDPICTLFSYKQRVSLKHCGIRLGVDLIQDLPYEHTKVLTQEEANEVAKYNINDCKVLKTLFINQEKEIQSRIDIATEFKLDPLDLINKDPVKVGIEIIKKDYLELSKRDFKEFKDHRPEMPEEGIHLLEVVNPKIHFETKENQELLETIKSTYVKSTKGDFKFKTKIGKLVISYGTGGVHSINDAGISIPKENETLETADVASLYPTIEINEACPRHLPGWNICKSNAKTSRIEAKLKKNKIKDAGLKLGLNGTYGMLGAKHWIGDYFTLLQVTVNGQLYLTMLAEKLHLAGFTIEELNTDGVNCFVPKDRYEEYRQICEDWCQFTNLVLEYDAYKSIHRTSVNDYVAVTTNGKVKRKGDFLHASERPLDKGWEYPVVSDAIVEYFLNKTPIMDTLMTKKAVKMKLCTEDSNGKIQVLQKTNRFIATNTGVMLKSITDTSVVSLYKDTRITVLNNILTYDTQQYDLNYKWYEERCQDIIDKVEGLTAEKMYIHRIGTDKYLNLKTGKETRRKVMYTLQDLRDYNFNKNEEYELIPV